VIGRLVRRLRSEHTFSVSQAAVLGRLDRDGAQTASALAAAEGVRPQSMAQTIAELESEGLVRRQPDPHDGRQSLVRLTREGRTTLKRDRLRREGWLAGALAAELSADEQQIMILAIPLLRRLTED
jgi:DNA-binding MarR family transcriptional regulator